MNEERMQILNMLQEGKITAADAAKLLEAVDATEATRPVKVAKFIRIRVFDDKSGKSKVNVNLPFSLIEVALRMGVKFAPTAGGPDLSALKIEELLQAVKEGVTGKIVDVCDEDGGQRVEIIVE
jgi:hypothetical protein